VTQSSQQPPAKTTKPATPPDEPDNRPLLDHLRKFSGGQPLPKGLITALIIALAISALSILIVNAFDGATKMRHWIMGAGAWAPLVYVGLKASTYIIAPLSGTPVKLAGGVLFGFWEGAALSLTGDMVGASANFWIARLFRDKAIHRLAGRKAIRQVDELTEHVGGWRALVAARLFLSSLYDFISYAAGLSKLPFKYFFLVSLIAGIPSTLSAAWFGNAAATSHKFLYLLFIASALGIVALLFTQKLGNSDKPDRS
jgi:uncharacterized membrane protein YdjX (TVP38/TMEM64 family)